MTCVLQILIPYESISEIAKTTTMVFQNAIRIATTGKDEYTFTSFWGNNRDGCYDLIAKTRNRVLNDLKPAVVRGLQRTSVALGGGGGDDERPASSSSSPVTSPVSMAAVAAKFGTTAAAAALTAQQQHEETDDADSDAENTQTSETSFARSDTIQEERDNSPQEQHQQEESSDNLHSLVRHASVVSDIGSVAPKDISMTQIVEETFDVSVDEFMTEFFWDDAKFGLDAFGASQGYTEMKCNPWMTPLEDDESSFGT